MFIYSCDSGSKIGSKYKEITYIILGGREGVFPQHFLQKVEYRKKQIIPSRKWYY
jgi:hypothetical protein